MRPSVASAFGRLMSIGSSATNTRPSGAQATTEGCLIFGASAMSSMRQPAIGWGSAEAATVADSRKRTKQTKRADRIVRAHFDTATGARAVPARSTSLGRSGLENSRVFTPDKPLRTGTVRGPAVAVARCARRNRQQEVSTDVPVTIVLQSFYLALWVCVGAGGSSPVAPEHVSAFGGRSVFLVMLRLPEGRHAAVSYLGQLRSFERPWVYTGAPREALQLNPEIPQFPTNTQWGLVRRMCVIDTEGRVQPTSIMESIQVRSYVQIPPGINPAID